MNYFNDYLKKAEKSNLKRQLRVVIPVSARECLVKNKKCLNFCSNNYLALADHPKLKEAAVKWTEKYGTGSTASRLVTGTYDAYVTVEEQVAQWKKSSAALILGSGYLANVGIIPALADRNTVILADKLNHASLNAGCQLSPTQFFRFKHNQLKCPDHIRNSSRKLIVSDTVFSMDGDLADVEKITEFSEENDGLAYLDDAHASGVFGENGEGLAHGTKNTVVMGTFSKAMGSYGAYVTCSKEIKEYLINKCGSFIYTTALPPGVYGAISASVELVQTEDFKKIRQKLKEKYQFLNCEIRNLGFNTGRTASPIIPVIIGDTETTLRISQFLFENDILAVAIRPPTVPKNSARLRISVNAAHTDNDLEYLLKILKKAKGQIKTIG